MKKLTISVLVLAVFSVQGFTQGGPCFQMTATDMALLAPLSWQPIENIPQGDFVRKISSLSISFIKDIELAEEAGINRIKPKKTEVKKTKRQYVSLSGYVNLSGSGVVPSNGGYTTVYLNDWATFKDASGQITSNRVYINERISFWSRENQYISESVYIKENVQLYKNGKNIGSAYISGSIRVSGWPSGNNIRLRGNGYLRGSFYLRTLMKPKNNTF